MKRILFVCLGNICRSPLAKSIFNHKIKEAGLVNIFECDSCGTSNYHIGSAPDERTIKNSLKNGVQINHAARQLTDQDFKTFDLILAMDKSNYDNILQLPSASDNLHKIKMMREFDPLERGDVPDPYYGEEKDFQQVFDILHRSVENLLQKHTMKAS